MRGFVYNTENNCSYLYTIQKNNHIIDGVLAILEVGCEDLKINPHEEVDLRKVYEYQKKYEAKAWSHIPLLLTYQLQNPHVEDWLINQRKTIPLNFIDFNKEIHSIREINFKEHNQILSTITKAKFYIGDGHHRYKALQLLAHAQRRTYFVPVCLVNTNAIKSRMFHKKLLIINRGEYLLDCIEQLGNLKIFSAQKASRQTKDLIFWWKNQWYQLSFENSALNGVDFFHSVLLPSLHRAGFLDKQERYIEHVAPNKKIVLGKNELFIKIPQINYRKALTIVDKKSVLPQHTTCIMHKPLNDPDFYKPIKLFEEYNLVLP